MHMKPRASKVKGKSSRKTQIKSLSLPKRILDLGMARAAAASRSFSNHVAVLIQKDASAAK